MLALCDQNVISKEGGYKERLLIPMKHSVVFQITGNTAKRGERKHSNSHEYNAETILNVKMIFLELKPQKPFSREQGQIVLKIVERTRRRLPITNPIAI